ncbi:glutaminase [Apiospora saccharicola]|uniref:Glutaminase n=1 Tax=Apiospora saccharicola TaxID=335842 RepID=A0ABR1UGW8_9PEZI
MIVAEETSPTSAIYFAASAIEILGLLFLKLILPGHKSLAITLDPNGNATPIYTPARPPAIPLAVRTPYLSAWSTTQYGAALNGNDPWFWTGDSLGWTGIVTVDGISYSYLGNGVQTLPKLPNYLAASPQTVAYDSSYSNFTFSAGPVNITASFFSPVLPKDLCRTSIPLSYLTTAVQSTDDKPHSVQFYSDINSAWIGDGADQTRTWEIHRNGAPINGTGNVTVAADTMYSWVYQPEKPMPFFEAGDRPQWGQVVYSTQPMGAYNVSFQSGYALDLRYNYITTQGLANTVDPAYRGSFAREAIFAYVHDFGQVSNAEVRYTVGLVQDQVIRSLYQGGLSQLQPWWKSCYSDMSSMIHFHWNDFLTVQDLANQAEGQLLRDIEAFYDDAQPVPDISSILPPPNPSTTWTAPTALPTQTITPIEDTPDDYGFLNSDNFTGMGIPDASESDSYYAIVALSARQVMGSFVYAIPPPTTCSCNTSSTTGEGEPFMFMKEISSDGNVNTLDVMFPATPFFLYANPEILKYALEPIFQFQESGFYPNQWAMHDLGEESGNLILMSFAYYKFSGNSDWLHRHYPTLSQSTSYLLSYSKIPDAQLSTDDFAGTLINQTNLAIKGVIALKAMSIMSRMTSITTTQDAGTSSTTVEDGTVQRFYQEWESFGIAPSRDHTLLTYQWRSSWGLLYNIYFDKLLNLGVVDKAVYLMQSDWYASVSQIYGVPLDNRHHYTKSDWQIFAAATCRAGTRKMFITSIAYWLNHTVTQFPFGDLYETIGNGDYPRVPDATTFKARPVVGGHFALLALLRTGQTAGAEAGDTSGSLFILNGTNALSNYTASQGGGHTSLDHGSMPGSRLDETRGDEGKEQSRKWW